jgi:zinc protease
MHFFRRPRVPAALVLAILLPGAAVSAQAPVSREIPARGDGALAPPTVYRLRNGLTVVLSEDDRLPLVSVVVAYKAGSIYEAPGKTGLATLLENLMFEGSADVPGHQHINLVNRMGGTLSAAASEERTLFYQTMPSNQLALALWMESDRMRFLEMNQDRFEKIRGDLLEELRQRRQSEPYWIGLASFDQLLYADFPFGHSVSGREEDIRGLTLEDARLFYGSLYGPNNAVLCITGDINKTRARELVSRYFETLPRGRELPPVPEPSAGVRKPAAGGAVDALAMAPAFYLGFRLVPPPARDYYTLVLIDYILLRGRTSRLNRRLLGLDNKIAYDLAGGIERRRDRAVYKIFVQASPAMIEPCQSAIFDEMDKLKRRFISVEELDKFKAILKQDYYLRISNALDRALFLVDAWLTLPELESVGRELDKFLAVTPGDIIGIANRYFTAENSVLWNIRTK